MYYVCYSEREQKFWNQTLGWVSYDIADYYTALEVRVSTPPDDGIWILTSKIKDGVVSIGETSNE